MLHELWRPTCPVTSLSLPPVPLQISALSLALCGMYGRVKITYGVPVVTLLPLVVLSIVTLGAVVVRRHSLTALCWWTTTDTPHRAAFHCRPIGSCMH